MAKEKKKIPILEVIGDKLKKLRQQKGINTNAMQHTLKIGNSVYGNIERGYDFRMTSFFRYCKRLRVPLSLKVNGIEYVIVKEEVENGN